MHEAMPAGGPPRHGGVAAVFDSLAVDYARTRERESSFIAQKQLVIEMLADVRGRVLDVGCGPAMMAPVLAAMGLEVHGIDLSGEMVRRAGERMAGDALAGRSHFAVGDFERLPYPDGFFDAVIAMGVLEYLPAYGEALRSTARVLKPGGIAVFTVPNSLSPYYIAHSAYTVLRKVVHPLRSRPAEAAAPNRCIPYFLDRQLARVGLRKVDSAACNFIFFPLKELLPDLSDSLNRALYQAARWPLGSAFGAQYVVKARRQGGADTARPA
jgi:ubiquinone/menaquinone biosynthesis C-methylase UbiE